MTMDPRPRWHAETAEPETEVAVAEEVETRLDTPWRVILFNDDVHTFDEVVYQLIKAIRCTVEKAERLTWEAHSKGRACVYESDFADCFRVQTILQEIDLVTELEG